MTGHRVESCDWPPPSRRWRNTIWVCQKCGKAWTLVYTNQPKPHSAGILSSAYWMWWPWPWDEESNQ